MKRIFFSILFCLSLAQFTRAQHAYPTLGQKIPSFKYGKFLKGEPFEHLNDDKIYVFEFWATWCGYCIQSFPHLSSLQERYKEDVQVVAIDVMEKVSKKEENPYLAKLEKVEEFMKGENANAIDFTVMMDTEDLYYENYWLPAQKILNPGIGIPFTIVVDKGGIVRWMGHPTIEGEFSLEKTLDKLVKGVFSDTEYANHLRSNILKRQEEEDARKEKRKQLLEDPRVVKMYALLDEGKSKDGLHYFYEEADFSDEFYQVTYLKRLEAIKQLSKEDPKSMLTLFDLIQQKSESISNELNFALDVASNLGKVPKLNKKLYLKAIQLLEGQVNETVFTYRWLYGLVGAYYYAGKKQEALKVLQRMEDRLTTWEADVTSVVKLRAEVQKEKMLTF